MSVIVPADAGSPTRRAGPTAETAKHEGRTARPCRLASCGPFASHIRPRAVRVTELPFALEYANFADLARADELLLVRRLDSDPGPVARRASIGEHPLEHRLFRNSVFGNHGVRLAASGRNRDGHARRIRLPQVSRLEPPEGSLGSSETEPSASTVGVENGLSTGFSPRAAACLFSSLFSSFSARRSFTICSRVLFAIVCCLLELEPIKPFLPIDVTHVPGRFASSHTCCRQRFVFCDVLPAA